MNVNNDFNLATGFKWVQISVLQLFQQLKTLSNFFGTKILKKVKIDFTFKTQCENSVVVLLIGFVIYEQKTHHISTISPLQKVRNDFSYDKMIALLVLQPFNRYLFNTKALRWRALPWRSDENIIDHLKV